MKNTLTLVSFLFPILLFSQITFQKSYDYCDGAPSTEGGRSFTVQESEDGYIVFTTNNYSCLGALKLDFEGNVQYHKEYEFAPEFYLTPYPGTAVKDGNGDFYLAAHIDNPGLNDDDIFLMKFSGETMDTLWSKRYRKPLNQKQSSMRMVGDKLILLGQTDSLFVKSDSSVINAVFYDVYGD